jgi:RNase P/RNase MRP subunit p30
MRRLYSDLHLCPNLKDPKEALAMMSTAHRFGYRLVTMTLPLGCSEEEFHRVQDACGEIGIDLASRVDLTPRTPGELVRNLRKVRRRFEVVSVMCDSKNVSRQAAKDRRVDLLNFPSSDFRRRFFDSAEAELASGSLASLEIDMKPLLVSEGPARVRLLSSLRRETAIAKGFHVPVVISSGVSNGLLMRRPMELAALATLFGLDRESALEAVSKNPSTIVRNNREKLSALFVAPGIRIVRRGKDC